MCLLYLSGSDISAMVKDGIKDGVQQTLAAILQVQYNISRYNRLDSSNNHFSFMYRVPKIKAVNLILLK